MSQNNTPKGPTIAIALAGVISTPVTDKREPLGRPLSSSTGDFLRVIQERGCRITIITGARTPREVRHWLKKHSLFRFVAVVAPMIPEDARAIIHPRAIHFDGVYAKALLELEDMWSAK